MISLGESRRSSNIMTYVIYILLVILHNIIFNGVTVAAHSVSTYKKASSVLNQLITSSTLEWEPYKSVDSLESKRKQLEFAIQVNYFCSLYFYTVYNLNIYIIIFWNNVRTINSSIKSMQCNVPLKTFPLSCSVLSGQIQELTQPTIIDKLSLKNYFY